MQEPSLVLSKLVVVLVVVLAIARGLLGLLRLHLRLPGLVDLSKTQGLQWGKAECGGKVFWVHREWFWEYALKIKH